MLIHLSLRMSNKYFYELKRIKFYCFLLLQQFVPGLVDVFFFFYFFEKLIESRRGEKRKSLSLDKKKTTRNRSMMINYAFMREKKDKVVYMSQWKSFPIASTNSKAKVYQYFIKFVNDGRL
jgi:hypothetical protein